ncbi:hypothetical protein LSCM1_05297 [Leishmania martiniquensis]|uniref:PUB domain-containing protein n=1 Tax=Leishmania martiniquensis TaxID=1580590 RepID=A0A836KSU3_9TRYP|nr:hypothetical protein LSCM1_05297 [Leishmania martiniquensis]
MNPAAAQVAATARLNEQSVPLLITCLHASAVSASSAEVCRAFHIIEKLLSNRMRHPTEQRYASFSATSTAWVDSVAPLVYVLRLAAWMGCTLTAEGARYVFVDSLGETNARGSGDAEGRRQLMDRLDELRCVASVWSTSTVETSGEASRRYQEAYQQLLQLFQSVQDSTDREKMWARHTDHLQLYRLRACARDVEWRQATVRSPAISDVPDREGAASWTVRAQRELDSSLHVPGSLPSSDEQGPSPTQALPILETQPGPRCESKALSICVADESIQWLLSRASLCELRRMCESAAAESTTSFSGGKERGSLTVVPLTPGFSVTVAKKLRQRAQREQHQRYLDTTGPAYRRLGHEERHRGESLIINIAAILEQLAVVTEAQGLVRHDRYEARRLLDEFRQDGDLAKLYALEVRYTAELEEAKLLHGKPLVYAASFEK